MVIALGAANAGSVVPLGYNAYSSSAVRGYHGSYRAPFFNSYPSSVGGRYNQYGHAGYSRYPSGHYDSSYY